MVAKVRENASVFQAMMKLQSVMILLAAVVIVTFDAYTIGKLLSIAVVFTVFSVVAFVHLQRRHQVENRLDMSPGSAALSGSEQ